MIDKRTSGIFYIYTFYKCIKINIPSSFRQKIRKQASNLNILGTIVISSEGINSTISSKSQNNLNLMTNLMEKEFGKITVRQSISDERPFKRLKVKVRRELVPSGSDLLIDNESNKYIDPKDWDKFIKQESVIAIDVRNQYEIDVGTFDNSISPKTKNFREFNQFIEESKSKIQDNKIAIFCTGGIRCEKASILFKEKGLDEVYQLEGGILNYFDKSKNKDNFKGECFVFDERVTVNKNLNRGNFSQCYACRRPLSKDDKNKPQYMEGISCHNCMNEKSEEDKKRFAERQKQNSLNKI